MYAATRQSFTQPLRFTCRRLATATVAGSADIRPAAESVLTMSTKQTDLTSGAPLKALPITRPVYVAMSSLIRPRQSENPSDKLAELDPTVFAHPIRRDILHLCVVHVLDSLRQGSANTKTRAEVRGSGFKIRPQKGTGKARLGDGQSPMLRGGGVAFGPKPRDFSTKLPRKVIQMGMRVALSARVKERGLRVVQSLDWQGVKTKEMAQRLEELGWGKTLFVTGRKTIPTGLDRSCSNLFMVDTATAEELNVYDLVKWPQVVLDIEAVEWFEKTLALAIILAVYSTVFKTVSIAYVSLLALTGAQAKVELEVADLKRVTSEEFCSINETDNLVTGVLGLAVPGRILALQRRPGLMSLNKRPLVTGPLISFFVKTSPDSNPTRRVIELLATESLSSALPLCHDVNYRYRPSRCRPPSYTMIGESLPADASRILSFLSPELTSQLEADTDLGKHTHCTGNASVWAVPELQESYATTNPYGIGWHLNRAAFEENLRETVRNKADGVHSRVLRARFQAVQRDAHGWIIDASGRRASFAKRVLALFTSITPTIVLTPIFQLGAKTVKLDSLLAFYTVFEIPEGAAPSWEEMRRIVVYHTDERDETSKIARKLEGFLHLLHSQTENISNVIEDSGYDIASDETFPRCMFAGTTYLEPVGDEDNLWYAVGDAAVAFDPLSSQGMVTAFKMGSLLGIELGRRLGGDPANPKPPKRSVPEVYQSTLLDYEKKKAQYYGQVQRFDGEFWRKRQEPEPESDESDTDSDESTTTTSAHTE
ncbi:hypothetical protein EW146_g1262 [Bondarzewia mesenterica]|uniref:Large ribosomal subunit protein uL4m n=1 Tax=Bondarzewia mesenterica TaxID=1095465 RepID=A0A4S4M4G0_9AGAM|nr:hypothetical protein EW146_g1262 [Bondarzewia mesenterica]